MFFLGTPVLQCGVTTSEKMHDGRGHAPRLPYIYILRTLTPYYPQPFLDWIVLASFSIFSCSSIPPFLPPLVSAESSSAVSATLHLKIQSSAQHTYAWAAGRVCFARTPLWPPHYYLPIEVEVCLSGLAHPPPPLSYTLLLWGVVMNFRHEAAPVKNKVD